jgi:hypothetical protein
MASALVLLVPTPFCRRDTDKKMVEMTAFEEFGLLERALSQAEDYS